MIKIGSHVGMNGKKMLLGSVEEALSYGANTFMVYTGAPQNTRRKAVSELRIDEAAELMKKNNMAPFIVHAPYIINLANTIKPETFRIAVDFLKIEVERTEAMGSKVLVLHPGSHVNEGVQAGTEQIIKGLNEVLTEDMTCKIALETMAGKGSEIGRTFEEIEAIIEGVELPEKLGVCFDTCHVHDAGYDIINDFDGVIEEFDNIIGKERILVFHINDSKNIRGSHKDRHENIGRGEIGFKALHNIVHYKDFIDVPKILETPYIENEVTKEKEPPYRKEIEALLSFV